MADCKTCKEMRAEEAAKEMNGDHSIEWELLKQASIQNKRLFISNIVLIILILLILIGTMYERLQYDYSSYEVSQGGERGNTFIGESNEGDITYGAENTNETETEKESIDG